MPEETGPWTGLGSSEGEVACWSGEGELRGADPAAGRSAFTV